MIVFFAMCSNLAAVTIWFNSDSRSGHYEVDNKKKNTTVICGVNEKLKDKIIQGVIKVVHEIIT